MGRMSPQCEGGVGRWVAMASASQGRCVPVSRWMKKAAQKAVRRLAAAASARAAAHGFASVSMPASLSYPPHTQYYGKRGESGSFWRGRIKRGRWCKRRDKDDTGPMAGAGLARAGSVAADPGPMSLGLGVDAWNEMMRSFLEELCNTLSDVPAVLAARSAFNVALAGGVPHAVKTGAQFRTVSVSRTKFHRIDCARGVPTVIFYVTLFTL